MRLAPLSALLLLALSAPAEPDSLKGRQTRTFERLRKQYSEGSLETSTALWRNI
jgi:hypothetical protein